MDRWAWGQLKPWLTHPRRPSGGSAVLHPARPHTRSALRFRRYANGEDAPVVVGGCRQRELSEDARDVLLDSPLGDHEPLGDAVIRAALGHQLQHLALARRELVKRTSPSPAADQARDNLRVKRCAASGHALDRGCEVLDV